VFDTSKKIFFSFPATLHSQKECDCVSNSVLRSSLVFLSFHNIFTANTVSILINTSSEMFLSFSADVFDIY
jgi:hypothetical protein